MYFLNAHFTRTSCNSSQVCTEESKDPNHQCINIALILCFNQLHCYVGGKQGPQLSVQMNIPCCRLCCIVQCHTHITPVAPSCTKPKTTWGKLQHDLQNILICISQSQGLIFIIPLVEQLVNSMFMWGGGG